jgi:hypothetical protein
MNHVKAKASVFYGARAFAGSIVINTDVDAVFGCCQKLQPRL